MTKGAEGKRKRNPRSTAGKKERKESTRNERSDFSCTFRVAVVVVSRETHHQAKYTEGEREKRKRPFHDFSYRSLSSLFLLSFSLWFPFSSKLWYFLLEILWNLLRYFLIELTEYVVQLFCPSDCLFTLETLLPSFPIFRWEQLHNHKTQTEAGKREIKIKIMKSTRNAHFASCLLFLFFEKIIIERDVL